MIPNSQRRAAFGRCHVANHLKPLEVLLLGAASLLAASDQLFAQTPVWDGYARDPQHSALSTVPSQPLSSILWQTPVDLNPQYSGDELLIHYGSPAVTAANTVIVPVKTGASDGFEIKAINGNNGSVLWTQSTDYLLPPHNWTPSYSPVLTPQNRLYYPGVGGSVYYRDNVNTAGAVMPSQIMFYGQSPAAFANSVYIDTPITSDAAGDIYFGFEVTGSTALPGLAAGQGGVARIAANGTATYVSAASASGDSTMNKVVMNSAPAVSPDESTVYVAVNNGNFSNGYLLALNSSTLATKAKVAPKDPVFGTNSPLPDDGTASPTVGPDGRVYFGVFDAANTSRGWMQQYALTPGAGNTFSLTAATPGGFGWDDTVSIVPASMVPSYHGTSSYLLMTKYNNYVETGGGGQNRIDLLDPNSAIIDNARNNPTGATIMQTVLTKLGPTPNANGGVYEWCINNAVVDPATDSILVNSEDGHLYRWNLATNTFSQQIMLTSGVGEAYTPTLIGTNGEVFAINNAVLFAVVPEPPAFLLTTVGIFGLIPIVHRRKRMKPPDPLVQVPRSRFTQMAFLLAGIVSEVK
jgi:hypothetical protein